MTRTTHTPKPWLAQAAFRSNRIFVNGGGATIAEVFTGPEHARLIAAAPDMLDALALVRMSMGWQYLAPETREIIDAALAKARGVFAATEGDVK